MIRCGLAPRCAGVFGLLALAAAACAAAAGAPPMPRAARPDVRLHALEQRAVPSPVQAEVPTGAGARPPAGAEAIAFVLHEVVLEGVSAYPPGALRDLIEVHYGQRVSLAEVYQLAASVQRRYREDGYFLTRVLVPPQAIVGGRVRLEVAEGRVDRIEFQGDAGPVTDLVRAYLSPVTAERPLRLETLERCLLLANDLPGLRVQGVLGASPDTVGAARLGVTVRRRRFEGFAVADNIGSTFNGDWEVAARAGANSFTRLGESIAVSALLSSPEQGIGGDARNQAVGAINGSLRLGDRGGYMNALLSYGDANPGSFISEFDYHSTQFLGSLAFGYPLIRARSQNLNLEGGFDYVDGATDVYTDVALTRDRIRVLWLTASYDARDRWRGANVLSLGVRQGLQWLGASPEDDPLRSRTDARSAFTSLRASVSRLQGITDHWALYLLSAGQYAFSPVLSEEEFDVGGMEFGRGYNPKELSGDRGVGVTTELQYSRPGPWSFVERWQGFGFFDFGAVWQSGLDQSQSLSSAGGGVRAWLRGDLSLELLVAKPLTLPSQRVDGTRDPQLLFRLSARF